MGSERYVRRDGLIVRFEKESLRADGGYFR